MKGNTNAVAVITFVYEHVEKRKKERHAPSCCSPKKLKIDVGGNSE